MVEEDLLFTLAEIAVAMAGFSAVVVVFRRRDQHGWARADADRLHGMILHSMASAFFCLLPSLLRVFTEDPAQVWALASGFIALQILAHCIVIFSLPSSGRSAVVPLLLGLAVSLLCASNALGIGFDREFRPYMVGVLWHVLQAGVLFVTLVWVRAEDIQAG